MLLAVEDAAGERVDRRALVSLGLVVADETEIHCGFYYRGRRGSGWGRENGQPERQFIQGTSV